MKLHKTIKGFNCKENVEMSYCISITHFSVDLWNFSRNMQPFPEIKQQLNFLKNKVSRSCLATFEALLLNWKLFLLV